MKSLIAFALAIIAAPWLAQPAAAAPAAKPTIVLVHGAFADASSWNGVISILVKDGYHVIAPPNPLRGPASDGASIHALLATIKTPVVLVGHSYGGMVISNAGNNAPNVKALVYVDAFAPDVGDTVGALNSKNPGSLLGPALEPPVLLPNGTHDLYIDPAKFHDAFAPDAPAEAALVAGIGQRPIADAAFAEKATAPAWKSIPSWFVYGDHDTAIVPKTLAFMAERAHPQKVVVIPGASHVALITRAPEVAKVIEEAAASVH
jgi:pimeloyl-ACP methyl ester carboxylesterase